MDRTSLSSHASPLMREELNHLVALDHQGMPGLAEYLLAADQTVSGSVDGESGVTQRLRDRGVRVHQGHSPHSVPRWTKRLIYPPGVSRTHPERLRALQLGVEQVTLDGAIREVLQYSSAITVIGHRVARVAATMIGWVLTQTGLDPNLILGAEIPQKLGQGRVGDGPYSVIDLPEALWSADMVGAQTELALVLDVGTPSDHSRASLLEMARALPETALLLGFANEPMMEAMARITPARVERLSVELDGTTEWWGADLRAKHGRYRFRTFRHGEFRLELGLSCPGRRYVLGALAAIAACHSIDLKDCAIREALEEYLGASRAFDHRGTYRGVTLIDDDATEPSDVAETLALARMVYGRRRLWAVCAPTKDFNLPVNCLAPADRVLLLGGDGSATLPGMDCASNPTSPWVRRAADREDAVRNLDRLLEPGDVLVTLGTGDMGTIADAFIRRLPRDRQGR